MISIRDVTKSFQLGAVAIPALRGVSLEIFQGEFIAITGPSGSGKSTLMNILGLLESYDRGSYQLMGYDIGHLSDDDAATLRGQKIGFVFQLFNLIPRLNAIRNVELPMVYAGIPASIRRARAQMALQTVGLADRVNHTSNQLSGGQQQRVAIARALVNNPDIIIADEPTGALDTVTSHDIMSLFQQLNANGKTIILVTHEDEIAAYARRVIHIRDGLIHMDRRLEG